MSDQHTFDCNILSCEAVSSDVFRVTLAAPKGELFDYLPGQYLFVIMAEDDARPYSIASAPGDGQTLQMHIKDIPDNDFTAQVLAKLKTESHIKIRLASGDCTLEKATANRPLLFISGGTGFAHSHSLIQHLQHSGDQRNVELYWGANKLEEIYLYDLPQQWMREHENFNFVPVINHPKHDWTGETGMVHEAVFRHINDIENYDVFLSGSSAMVFNIYRQLRDKKVPCSQIFSDMLDILREKDEL